MPRSLVLKRIVGDIAASEHPGKVMRKWRKVFHASQVEVARRMGVSPSVISEYETGKTKSPRVDTVRKFVESLIEIDEERGGNIVSALENVLFSEELLVTLIGIGEFPYPRKLEEVYEAIEAEPVVHHGNVDVFGYTVIDSVKTILEVPARSLIRVYGECPNRVLVFTRIDRGRSPMVAIKAAGVKPSAVILHGIDKSEVDDIGIKIAEVEGINLATTTESISKISKRLKELTEVQSGGHG
ncbi:helix-turn-helix domain-containing protein [Methanopyrus sp. KOL6]|uniref:helix-turn-helix domain-containing protein n=1 Tax=Methanopyrus sp. KOL6 TaxID=1937004 RepID=UPI000B4B2C97|nr:helix-turn-helix domain-containing protein [Methanopyrus sp. KOL6]